MILNVYAMKDSRSGWLNPTFEANDQIAVRNFTHAVQTSGTVLTSHKQDFSLYQIGTYDTDSGLINSCIPAFIIGGDEIVLS